MKQFELPFHQELISHSLGSTGMNKPPQFSSSPPAERCFLGLGRSVKSVILKYAPPYMASDPTRPCLVYRQTVEANALAMLHPLAHSPLTVSALLNKYPIIKIPQLVDHDVERSVLAMTDLGEIMNLEEWLASEATAMADVERIGTTLGNYLAEFFVGTSNPSPETLTRASNDVLMGEFYEDDVRIMNEILERENVYDRAVLLRRVRNAIEQIGRIEPVLGMVDLWTGNIAIDPYGNCALIDWEYFGMSDVGHDIGMLSA